MKKDPGGFLILDRGELYRIQREIASRTILEDWISLDQIELVAGVDQAFLRGGDDEGEMIISAVVVLEYPSMKPLDSSYAILSVDFPYIPGLLTFREAPSIIKAFSSLDRKPDVLFVDGCGINHPRFAGLATHVGVTLDIPTVGVAKNILCGEGDLPVKEGDASIITYRGREVGYYLKSKKGCKPIIVAPGHKISPESSLKLVKSCIRGYKLPEPTRIAHLLANKIKRDGGS
ncbi:MAG TPA: endonuclease V [Candidatus Syntrophoarchaeum butanivorans]|uniref:Endonuclease V n=1 Tax=Candidatus Syntropharchaeum butanivorans TaxID=1839936 RepID=A0A7J2RYK8_9EURY|nr:endonuclease V [Candidatus Syntrophoarchaeum butanivorans]